MYWGDSVYAKVKAINIVGESAFSEVGNGAFMITKPDAPVNLADNLPFTHKTQIALTWEDGAENGGTPVIDYRIQYAAGNGPYIVLVSGLTV